MKIKYVLQFLITCLFGGLLCCMSAPSIEAASFYVSPTGNNANNGSLSSPWKTIQYAVDKATSGDTIFARAGVYNELVTIENKGTTAEMLTITNYPGEAAILDGTGLSHDWETGLFLIRNSTYITIQGFELRNLMTNNVNHDPAGICVLKTDDTTHATGHIKLLDNNIHDIRNTAGGPNTVASAHGLVVNGTVGGSPIVDVIIEGNDIHHCVLSWSESLTLKGNVDGFRIANNRVHDNNNIGILMAGGYDDCPSCNNEAENRARNGVCVGNLVYNINSATNPAYGGGRSAGGIYVDGGSDIVVEQNIVHHSNYGVELASENTGYVTRNVTLRNNFIYQNDIAGLTMGGSDTTNGGVQFCDIVNNTFFENDSLRDNNGEIWFQHKTQNMRFRNNIVIANAQNLFISHPYNDAKNNSSNNNIYFSPGGASASEWQWQGAAYSTLSNWRSKTGNDVNTQFANPQLANPATGNLHLTSLSPARDAGTDIGTISGAADIDGDVRVQQTIDIGADEFNDQPAVTPTPNVTPTPVVTATATPTATPTPVATATPISVTSLYQAENAKYSGGCSVNANNRGFRGAGFINFPKNGGRVEFSNVNGGRGGRATIRLRYALDSSARRGNLIINGVTQSISFASTGTWTTWTDKTITANLNQGLRNVIRLQSTGQDLANLDEIEITLSAGLSHAQNAASKRAVLSASADIPAMPAVRAAAPEETTPIPEPATMMMVGIGIALLVYYTRTRRKN